MKNENKIDMYGTVKIVSDGECGLWWGCAALIREDEYKKINATNKGVDTEFYDARLENWDEPGWRCIATYGGAPEDASRWVEGSGWRQARTTDVYEDAVDCHRTGWDMDEDELEFWTDLKKELMGMAEELDSEYTEEE